MPNIAVCTVGYQRVPFVGDPCWYRCWSQIVSKVSACPPLQPQPGGKDSHAKHSNPCRQVIIRKVQPRSEYINDGDDKDAYQNKDPQTLLNGCHELWRADIRDHGHALSAKSPEMGYPKPPSCNCTEQVKNFKYAVHHM